MISFTSSDVNRLFVSCGSSVTTAPLSWWPGVDPVLLTHTGLAKNGIYCEVCWPTGLVAVRLDSGICVFRIEGFVRAMMYPDMLPVRFWLLRVFCFLKCDFARGVALFDSDPSNRPTLSLSLSGPCVCLESPC